MATYPSVPKPDYPLLEGYKYDVLTTNIPGKEVTRKRHSTERKTWRLTYSAIHDGDAKYIWDFYVARKGKYESFTFVHPETAGSFTARFDDDTLKRVEIGLNLFDIEVNLVEVW